MIFVELMSEEGAAEVVIESGRNLTDPTAEAAELQAIGEVMTRPLSHSKVRALGPVLPSTGGSIGLTRSDQE
ncbi:hypothetical protein [Actinopolymorpha alba]|uniref:hypothetical protein n=1 Tax=Actinopolymorpha alba TaxID=533267 RepID=UPI000366B24E|nr:hypothetical protein [Actinopolymorpha alba]